MSDIIGAAAAAAELNSLVAQIQASMRAAPGDRATIDNAKASLRAFTTRTRPADPLNDDEMKAVDDVNDIAFDMLADLGLQQIAAGVAGLQRGADRLGALGTQLGEQAAGNQAAADSISLKPVKQAIDSMTGMVNSVKSLKANLKADDPDEARIAAEIDKLVAQFETLRTAVGQIG
jgi:hypothetical protein